MSHEPHAASHTLDRLIYMANQIGGFFAVQGHDKEVAGVADHIAKFWNSRMQKQIFAHLAKGGDGLKPNIKEALQVLEKRQQAQAAQQQ
ncbi:formate dehydrogenase subunit delta [uncultured Methylovirgula sp.]|uniref:formate dehydrogenase subunit delta n=1 Tax=uncultured Methylovirgula sp. TaxID=1285960 RepID=UPI00263812A5|nr:formate dehydrogenase subunit delta [uncultured Methylovirgula sp.]